MAYREFSNIDVFLPDIAAPLVRSARLGALERDVVMLARNDGLSSIRPEIRMERLSRKLFGTRTSNRLADPRLEALRRFSVIEIRTGTAGADEVSKLLDLGFSDLQIEQARQIAVRYHRPDRFSLNALVAVLANAIACFGAYLWVRARLGDSFISAMIVAYLGLPAIPSI
jgi:hypothetical protein